jgi:hypothetical protein
MRSAARGDVWEWCAKSDGPEHEMWEPVLLLHAVGPSIKPPAGQEGDDLHDWMALDLLNGEVCKVYNVPGFGWEKVE